MMGLYLFFPFNRCSSSSTNFVLLSIIYIIYCIVLPYNQSVDFTEKELICFDEFVHAVSYTVVLHA